MKAIVLGATSGIGLALARVLAGKGYELGLAGRRRERLEQLRDELPQQAWAQPIDIADPHEARHRLQHLIDEMRRVDLIVINSGVRHENPALTWELEQATIDVNVSGFAAMANVAFRHFQQQGGGHLVGISSIAGLRGRRNAPAYNASKSFVSTYLEGLRHKAVKTGLSITITDIRPGLVLTSMVAGRGLFWASTPEKAAGQIYTAIKNKKNIVYITKRWSIIAWILIMIPEFIYNRV